MKPLLVCLAVVAAIHLAPIVIYCVARVLLP